MVGKRLSESNSPPANSASSNGASVPNTDASLNEKENLIFTMQQVSSTNNAMIKLTDKVSAHNRLCVKPTD